MNKTEKLIYEILKKAVFFRDEKGIYTIFPQKLLIQASGKSERTVQYTLKNLENDGYITRIMYQEVNLMKFYFLKENDLTGLEIIDRTENGTSLSENCPPSEKNCPPSEKSCTPSEKSCTPSEKSCTPSEKSCTPSEKSCTPSEKNCPPSEKSCTSLFEKLPEIKPTRLAGIQYPLDKVNSTLWYGFPIGEVKDLKAESDKDSRKGKQANIRLLLDFKALNNVNISRALTVYDKWVWNACANLKDQGNNVFTVEQVHKAMGNTGRPNEKTKERIMESIDMISRAMVTIDTTEEHDLYPKYERIKATFPLLATETCTAYSRGQIVKTAIKILDTPKLFAFAENRHQITKLPLDILDSPISKTDDNLLLSDYLLTRISKMRNSKNITKTILIDTICQRCCIETYKQKQRLPEKIEKILNHYKKLKWIKDFKITEREIEIITF